jgi:hypothetical protein
VQHVEWATLELHLTPARLARYLACCSGDEDAATAMYAKNILIAEAMTPLLHVLEVSLRNGVAHQLTERYGRADWWEVWRGRPLFESQCAHVEQARSKLRRRREPQTSDKIVAELPFGFWCSLFNSSLQHELWKDLRRAFPGCPKTARKRHHVSSALNRLRQLRNRVFHHESLLWLRPDMGEQHQAGLQVVDWIDPQLKQWLVPMDRLPMVLNLRRPDQERQPREPIEHEERAWLRGHPRAS